MTYVTPQEQVNQIVSAAASAAALMAVFAFLRAMVRGMLAAPEGSPALLPQTRQYGPPKTAPAEIQQLWRDTLAEVRRELPLGSPQLEREAELAGASQEEVQLMAAHQRFLAERRRLLERWEEEEEMLPQVGRRPAEEARRLREEIVRLHREGKSPAEIAEELGIRRTLVTYHLRQAGIRMRAERREEIIALHHQGLSPDEIALRLGVTRADVRHHLEQAGLRPVPAERLREAMRRRREIVELHRQGLTPRQIADRLGLSLGYVDYRIREAGMAPHLPPEQERLLTERRVEIASMLRQGIPRHLIVQRTGVVWRLVSRVMDEEGIEPPLPASADLAEWARSLLPLIEEIRRAAPDTEPLLRRQERLERQLVAIEEAAWAEQERLPWRGRGVAEERHLLGDISYHARNAGTYMGPLRRCLRDMDRAELPWHLQRAENCIANITSVVGSTIRRVA